VGAEGASGAEEGARRALRRWFEQALGQGTTFEVRIKHPHALRVVLRDPAAVDRVRARQIAEVAVELTLVARRLELRASDLATPLSRWLDRSRIRFVTNATSQAERTHVVALSRADVDGAQVLFRPGSSTSALPGSCANKRPPSRIDFSSTPSLSTPAPTARSTGLG
jgi:hypothetical protein